MPEQHAHTLLHAKYALSHIGYIRTLAAILTKIETYPTPIPPALYTHIPRITLSLPH